MRCHINRSIEMCGAKLSALIAVCKQWIMLISRIVMCAFIMNFPLALLRNRTVEDIVLRDENDIEQQTDVCQAKFDRVACQSTPVCLQGTVYQQLDHAQKPAAEIEQLLGNGPPDCGLPLEVGEDLRDIFPDGQDQLNVLDGINLVRQCQRPRI